MQHCRPQFVLASLLRVTGASVRDITDKHKYVCLSVVIPAVNSGKWTVSIG